MADPEREESVLLPIEGGVVVKQKRGFAVMDPGRQREIASRGGRAAHEKGTAHKWSEEEAKEAGRKGGAASHRNGHRTATRVEVESVNQHLATEELATNGSAAEEPGANEPEPKLDP